MGKRFEDDPLSDFNQADDGALVEETLNGNERAFEVLMERYGAVVTGYLYRRAATREDERDLFQEVFLAAYANLRRLRNRDRFGPWLLRIARSRVADHLRREIKSRAREAKLATQDPATANPADRLSQELTEAAVLEAMAGIGEKYRGILHMRLIGESEPQDIARLLGMNESTVRTRLNRGLRDLRTRLEKRGIRPAGDERQ